MNKVICRMALILAVASLSGCGLKGPLYYPPQDKPQTQTSDAASPTETTTSPDASSQTGNPSTTEPELQSAQ